MSNHSDTLLKVLVVEDECMVRSFLHWIFLKKPDVSSLRRARQSAQ